MPPSLQEWLPEDHLAYFVSDTIDAMDISEIAAVYENSLRLGISPIFEPYPTFVSCIFQR